MVTIELHVNSSFSGRTVCISAGLVSRIKSTPHYCQLYFPIIYFTNVGGWFLEKKKSNVLFSVSCPSGIVVSVTINTYQTCMCQLTYCTERMMFIELMHSDCMKPTNV